MTEPLILERVTLRNFLSHRDTTVEFTRGVNVLIGPNGAGKTSILEAIHYALTGKGWRTGGAKRDLVNERAREGEVILEFTINGHKYRIHRFIGGRQSVIYRDNKPQAVGETQVNDYVKELLGIPLDQLDKIVIIRQGGITRLFTQLPPKKRREAIDQLLGLHQYQEAGRKLKEQIEFRPATKTTAPTLTPKKTLESEIKRIEAQITSIYRKKLEEYLSLDRELEEAKKKLRILEDKARKLQPLAERFDELSSEYSEISRRHGELIGAKKSLEEEAREVFKRIEDLDGKIREIIEALKKYEKELEILNYEEEIEELGKLINEKSLLEERIASLEKLLEKNEEILKSINELRGEVRYGLEEIDSKLSKTGESIEELRREKTELEREQGGIEDRLKHLSTEREELGRAIDEIRELYGEVFGEKPGKPGILLEKIEGKLVELKNNYRNVQDELLEIEKEISALESRINELSEKIKLLQSTDEPVCPLCGRPLTEEHRRRIIEKLAWEIEDIRKELGKRVEEKEKLAREKERLEGILEKITDTLITDLRQSIEKLNIIERELVELEERKKEITDEISQLEDRIKDLEKEREMLKEMKSKALTLRKLEEAFNEEEYRLGIEELKTLREKLESIKAEIDKLVAGLVGRIQVETMDPGEIYSRGVKLLEEARKARKELDRMRGELEALRRERERYAAEYVEKKKQLEKIEEEIIGIEDMLKELEKQLEEARKAREELDNVKSMIAGLKALIQSHDERKKKLLEEIEDIKKDVDEINKAYRKAAILRWIIENLLSDAGIPRLLRPRILRILESYMEEYMNEFNLGFQDIEIDENYNIYFRPVENPTIKRPLARLSGGEKVSMSMVALLALFHLVSQSRIGFMALDEPTEYLDEDRQKALVELLKKFQGGRILPQLVIVTHDESVKEAADRLFVVRKGMDGYSSVEIVAPGEEF